MKIDVYYDIQKSSTYFILNQQIQFKYFDKIITIPIGFRSDGMSVPSLFWSLISPKIDGKTLIQSICHDYLFQQKLGFFKSNWWYFKKLKNKLNLFKRILVLLGITLGGWINYYFK